MQATSSELRHRPLPRLQLAAGRVGVSINDDNTLIAVQWLALTPPALVKAHLNLDDETIAHLNKTKGTVVGPKAT